MIDELGSKKWRTLLLSFGAMMFEQYQDAPWYMVVSVAFVAAVYLIAQGMADAGKSRMQVIVNAIEKGIIDGKQLAEAVKAETETGGSVKQ